MDLVEATLKKNIVSGPAAGCVHYCRMGTFFFILPPQKIVGQNFIIFLPKKKKGNKKLILRPPPGHNFGHPLDRKQTFFKGGLSV